MALFELLILSLFLFSFSTRKTTLAQAQCLPDQRHALIQLKEGFNTTNLNSWNASTDCCIWDGITCDKQTGMVTALDLYCKFISGKLNPAIFNLSSLQYLDLSYNYFSNITLPQTGFELLPNLTNLDLSNSGFAGQVPISISALTKLTSLDLSTYNHNTNPWYLHDTGLKTLLSNLTKLQVLCMDGVDLSLKGSEWGKAVFQVGPTLQELSMVDCGLRGNVPDEIFHLTNLTHLDLAFNSLFFGLLPKFKKQSLLQYLSFENTNFTGPLPDSIGNLQYLSVLNLYNCSIYGELPPSITNLTRLEDLCLGLNILTGTIPKSLFSIPSLESLYISHNQLSGYLPEFSNGSSFLANIYLGYNNLEGQLPVSIFKFPQLKQLSLASNNFNGTINLDVIKHNKNLVYLDLSNNKFSIIEGKNHNESFYASFPQMLDIWLASCNLTKFPSFMIYQTHIANLDLSNNNIDGGIPHWLWNNEAIIHLNLSHNFFDKIEWDENFTSLGSLVVLDIHSNKFSGPVPVLPPGIQYADFSSNYFFLLPTYFISTPIYLSFSNNTLTGVIPHSICNATWPIVLHFSLLQVLDLSYNNLTGTMPPCLLEEAEFRVVLNLKSNQLRGPLPRNINQACQLRTIDLSENRINGSLPQSLMNCNNLEVIDLGNNQIVDRFPFWLGNLRNLRVLVIRSNQFYGTISNMEFKTKQNNSFFPVLMAFDLSSNRFGGIIPKTIFENLKAMVTNSDSSTFQFGGSNYQYSDRSNTYKAYYENSITVIWKEQVMEIKETLNMFSSLDLSQNGFSGEIPEEIGHLKTLVGLNLSHNALTGPIPSEISKLQQLQSLDLSCNNLFGSIPQELTSLHFLSALNLSYNNLVGEIPQVPQLSTFSNASYLGNPELCGNPLTMHCATPSNDEFNKDLSSKSSSDIIGLSVSIGLGLGVGFASVIWVLISWENGRELFNFIVDRFYFRHIPWIVLHLRLAMVGNNNSGPFFIIFKCMVLMPTHDYVVSVCFSLKHFVFCDLKYLMVVIVKVNKVVITS